MNLNDLDGFNIQQDFLGEALSNLKDGETEIALTPAPAATGGDEGGDGGEGDDEPLSDEQKAAAAKAFQERQQQEADINDLVDEELFGEKGPGGDDDDEEEEEEEKPADKKKPAAPAKKPEAKPAGEGGEEEGVPEGADPALYAFYLEGVEKGVYDEIEGFAPKSMDDLMEAARQTEENRIAAGLDAYVTTAINGQPQQAPKVKALIQHMAAGGNIDEFIDLYKGDTIDLGALDGDDVKAAEAAAISAMREYYTSIGWETADTEKLIADSQKAGTVVAQGKIVAPQLNKLKETTRATRQAQLDKAAKERQDAAASFRSTLQELIEKNANFNGFTIGKTPENKQKIKDRFFTASVELENGQKITPFMRDMQEAQKDPAWTLYLGLAYENFKAGKKPEALVTETSTKAAKDLKEKIANYAAGRGLVTGNASSGQSNSSQNTRKKGGLADLIS